MKFEQKSTSENIKQFAGKIFDILIEQGFFKDSDGREREEFVELWNPTEYVNGWRFTLDMKLKINEDGIVYLSVSSLYTEKDEDIDPQYKELITRTNDALANLGEVPIQ